MRPPTRRALAATRQHLAEAFATEDLVPGTTARVDVAPDRPDALLLVQDYRIPGTDHRLGYRILIHAWLSADFRAYAIRKAVKRFAAEIRERTADPAPTPTPISKETP